MSGIKITDLPACYQDQVRRQLGATSASTAMTNIVQAPKGMKPYKQPKESKPKEDKIVGGLKVSKKRQPNDTEAKYNQGHLDGKGEFEAVTLKLPGGSKYTPDFVTWDGHGRMIAHEVKGDYHFKSHGRAVTAFKECVARFPKVMFVWASLHEGDFQIQKFNENLS